MNDDNSSVFTSTFFDLTWQCPKCCSILGVTITIFPRQVIAIKNPLTNFIKDSALEWLILKLHGLFTLLLKTILPIENQKEKHPSRRMKEREKDSCLNATILKIKFFKCENGSYHNRCEGHVPRIAICPFYQYALMNQPHLERVQQVLELIYSIYHVDFSQLDYAPHVRYCCNCNEIKNTLFKTNCIKIIHYFKIDFSLHFFLLCFVFLLIFKKVSQC